MAGTASRPCGHHPRHRGVYGRSRSSGRSSYREPSTCWWRSDPGAAAGGRVAAGVAAAGPVWRSAGVPAVQVGVRGLWRVGDHHRGGAAARLHRHTCAPATAGSIFSRPARWLETALVTLVITAAIVGGGVHGRLADRATRRGAPWLAVGLTAWFAVAVVTVLQPVLWDPLVLSTIAAAAHRPGRPRWCTGSRRAWTSIHAPSRSPMRGRRPPRRTRSWTASARPSGS